jgi:hypothetical protein
MALVIEVAGRKLKALNPSSSPCFMLTLCETLDLPPGYEIFPPTESRIELLSRVKRYWIFIVIRGKSE